MILHHNTIQEISDKPFRSECPHCGDKTNLILTSPPDYALLSRYKPQNIGMVFQCSSCLFPIFLKFTVSRYEAYKIHIENNPVEIEKPTIDFEFEFIPENVVSDFKEALGCYSICAYNGFAAMSRRTIQSAADEIGAKGKSKVQHQIKEMKEMSDIDDETFDILNQIIINGHDGAHPHLPSLSAERAEILLVLLKDVMYQLFVRKGKLRKAADLRKEQIQLDK